MYFSNSHSQSEECVLLENDYMNQDYYVNNGTNGINTKLNGNIINVNEYFQNVRKKRNKRKKYFNVTTDYVPMNSDSSETVNNTTFLSGPMGLIFCGQLGKTALATVGLANSVFNVAGLAVITGLLTAVDTLFSQIFGSSNKGLMGVHLQRAIVISFIMCMPCWSLYLCIEPILLGLKQNPLMAKKASEYLLFMIPGLYVSLN
uniref:Multidrug and toxin extrusion protein 1 n=1 Tax=Schistosoma haematobium TaxID=6185 RepID=A0A094ZJY6_SCHHA